jgi:mono/diheme cytochrome c family protein
MRFLSFIGAIAIVVTVAVGVYVFGGFYNIAASVDDLGVVDWVLVRVREASISRHAGETSVIKLEDPQVIRAGARVFAQQGCANCHGGPGVDWAKFAEGLNPGPPDLKDVATLAPEQLFWIVKNGIRMTGMPSFAKAGVSDDDIWRVAAFIRKMPNISEGDYKSWTAP